MPALLYGIGAFTLFAGLLMIGFGIPINEFSFGNTLIGAGTTASVGGHTQHERTAFSCGQLSLDRFLKESARQNQDKGVSRTFVLHTGNSFGCHLHYEIHVNGTPVNPVPFMAARGISV